MTALCYQQSHREEQKSRGGGGGGGKQEEKAWRPSTESREASEKELQPAVKVTTIKIIQLRHEQQTSVCACVCVLVRKLKTKWGNRGYQMYSTSFLVVAGKSKFTKVLQKNEATVNMRAKTYEVKSITSSIHLHCMWASCLHSLHLQTSTVVTLICGRIIRFVTNNLYTLPPFDSPQASWTDKATLSARTHSI